MDPEVAMLVKYCHEVYGENRPMYQYKLKLPVRMLTVSCLDLPGSLHIFFNGPIHYMRSCIDYKMS